MRIADFRNGTRQQASAFGGVVGLRIMQNEPNSVVGRGRTRRNAQNEANLPRAPKNGRGQPGPGTSCGDRLCETKPIPGCTGWDGGQRMLYKQTQSGGTPAVACRLGPARAGCTNKPNLPPPDGQARPWLEPIAPNKPNCPKRGTEAVSAVAASGSPHYSSIPSFHHSSPMPIVQNKTQFRSLGRLDAGASCANKPNSRRCADREIGVPRRTDCAKRTQFPAAPGVARPGGRGCRTNKANSRQARLRPQGSLLTPSPALGLLGKQSQVPAGKSPCTRRATSWLEPIAPNKPNCPKRGTEAVSGVAASERPIIPVFHHSTIPVRCLSCETNPIRTGAM